MQAFSWNYLFSGQCFTLSQLIKRRSYHRETSQLICSANPLTGFYMMATLASNELMFYGILVNVPSVWKPVDYYVLQVNLF